ncbi:RagB/SusD family nutrient uptake outer membrane protein [Cytophagaceae bacterium 50C-KIRBA]|uniref:RagB/SusD family nutrient uptake outer membrane protein n=1 Tax=Aquirufa beregesia TaxID=2516556 RepID=A0ABX0EWG1_9BACT|nr:RagB/SusD family nutrient uptake outer membrane protein [Aquirufa beregesia]NGZ44416.1 RagB/SusD family nutrient uptake outer membrane protein [Aquirufa beregesia]
MKNIYVFLIFTIVLTGCKDNFLEIYPKSTLSEGSFYQSDVEFTLLANGCYVPMRDYEKNQHWILAELISDNASFQNNVKTGEASKGVIDQFILNSDNIAYSGFWNLSYNGITRCNKLLSELDRPNVNWTKASLKERCKGEALFLRSLYYFNLVRQFGGVPLVLNPVTSQEAVLIKRSKDSQIYDSIIADLKEAALSFGKARDVEENGRANEMSVLALLGKVYLTIGNFTEAEKVLSSVINSGKYALLPVYADLFNPSKKDFKETIFAIQYSENSVELSNQFIFTFAPHTSGGAITNRPNVNIVAAGWNQPTQDLINAFEEGDKRKEVSIGIWVGLDWDNKVKPIPYCGKYKAPISAPDARCGDNLPILRYSDVLLMYAEVLNELKRTSDAIPYIQLVRNRAGLVKPLATNNLEEVRVIIAKERQTEFCFENQRWYDLKRTGKAVEVMAAHGIREKASKVFLYPESFTLNTNKLLAPIPVSEVSINKIDQNPGY